LGRKYDFNTLYHIAIKRLAFENPATLEQYDAWSEAKLAAAAGRPLLDFATTRIVNYPGIQFDFLALARENSLLPMLPFAYFSVANLPLVSIPDSFSYKQLNPLRPPCSGSPAGQTEHPTCYRLMTVP
jgi:hypothetical protein